MKLLSASAPLIAGFFLSLSSTDALDYHWVPTSPGDGTSGSLTIPDADTTPGFHSLLPAPSGSWEDPAGNVSVPGPNFTIIIHPDGVLQEQGNFWMLGSLHDLPFSGETTIVFGFLPNGAPTSFVGTWVPDSTGVPDGGSTFVLAGTALLALLADRFSRVEKPSHS